MKYDPGQITFFAKTDARGQEIPFGIKADDRTRHVYVIGKTGMGKSTLLENMAVQDIKNGNGLAFIDPHGQTAETLLDYIPEERKDDVVYFAPFDTDYPISFNVMEDVGPDRRHLVVSGLMSVFKKIWVDAWSARMEYILSNTLLALLEYPDATLLGVNRMLSDKHYRLKVIDNITDPAVKSFWVDEFLKYNERYMQEAGDAIKNKIGQFTSNPLIRNIIGQPHSSFDIREIMDQKKILIINLSKGLVGEQNANLLGSMLTTRIYLAAMSRANLSPMEMKESPNFYFYVDEFQSFANATFADILSEARKYKLNLTIAHQYIEQMEEEVRNAVFGNVGTIISFRVGPFDAEILESIYTPKFLAPDIVNLGFAQIYLTLMIDGIGSQPFSATTLPPIELVNDSFKEIVKDRSRKLYGHPRSGVEAVINAWHHEDHKPPKPPRNNTSSTNNNAGNANNAGNNRNNNDRNQQTSTRQNGSEYKRNNDSRPTRSATSTANTQRRETPRPQSQSQSQSPRAESAKYDTRSNTDSAPPVRKEVRKEKNLDDLRSVLKGISSQTSTHDKKEKQDTPEKRNTDRPERTEKSGKPERRAERREDQNPRTERQNDRKAPEQKPSHTPENTNTLKDALASALKEASPEKKPKPQNTDREESKPSTEKSHKRDDHQQAPKNQNRPTQRPAPVEQKPSSEYAQMKNLDDPLSPKKLERMMRVTTSDKAPLK